LFSTSAECGLGLCKRRLVHFPTHVIHFSVQIHLNPGLHIGIPAPKGFTAAHDPFACLEQLQHPLFREHARNWSSFSSVSLSTDSGTWIESSLFSTSAECGLGLCKRRLVHFPTHVIHFSVQIHLNPGLHIGIPAPKGFTAAHDPFACLEQLQHPLFREHARNWSSVDPFNSSSTVSESWVFSFKKWDSIPFSGTFSAPEFLDRQAVHDPSLTLTHWTLTQLESLEQSSQQASGLEQPLFCKSKPICSQW